MNGSPCPSYASVGRRLGRVLGLVGLASAITWAAACGSDARANNECRQLEAARCVKLDSKECGGVVGGAASCERFYDVQCERGIADDATQPSDAELKRCLAAIALSCDVARAPETFTECKFLSTTNPPEAGLDTSAESSADAANETAADAATEASAETAAETASETAADSAGEAAAEAAADADDAG